MQRMSEMTETVFDGKDFPYVPPAQLRISPRLKLHQTWDEDVDPVTFEVIRHHLWHINEEHGATDLLRLETDGSDEVVQVIPILQKALHRRLPYDRQQRTGALAVTAVSVRFEERVGVRLLRVRDRTVEQFPALASGLVLQRSRR